MPGLLRALAALDYPPAKLDIKLLIEADDRETRAALAPGLAARPVRGDHGPAGGAAQPSRGRSMPACRWPAGTCSRSTTPRTSPIPGSCALAAALFARLPARTACLQGRLVIDNADDSWLTRAYALEYAGLFDVLNPALARCRLPVRSAARRCTCASGCSRALGGWDAYNVTEDADLGMRLALAGYTVGDLPSATIEEARADSGPGSATHPLAQGACPDEPHPWAPPAGERTPPRRAGDALRRGPGPRHGGLGPGLPGLPPGRSGPS